MKLIFENYRKHLHEQELNELRTQILNEISEDDYEVIKRWMRNAPEEAYSFRNLFGNKKRIAIPVETGAADGPFTSRVAELCMQKGLLVVHTGRESIKIGPPLTITDEALLEGVSVLGEAISEVAAK